MAICFCAPAHARGPELGPACDRPRPPAAACALQMFHSLQLLRRFGLSPTVLEATLDGCMGKMRALPFHNWHHVFTVSLHVWRFFMHSPTLYGMTHSLDRLARAGFRVQGFSPEAWRAWGAGGDARPHPCRLRCWLRFATTWTTLGRPTPSRRAQALRMTCALYCRAAAACRRCPLAHVEGPPLARSTSGHSSPSSSATSPFWSTTTGFGALTMRLRCFHGAATPEPRPCPRCRAATWRSCCWRTRSCWPRCPRRTSGLCGRSSSKAFCTPTWPRTRLWWTS